MARIRLSDAAPSNGGSYFASAKAGIEFIHSGCKVFDLALGGGWAEGRIANIVGDKSTGKTLLAIEASANFLHKYKERKVKAKVRYRETEAAFDEEYAAALGMPTHLVDFGDPIYTVEGLFKDLNAVVEGAKGPELYILDSLDALSDEAELERDMDKGTFGAQKAKNLSQLFRRLTMKMAKKQVTVIIISQVRDKIGAMFGRKTTRSGGRALDFYASQVAYLQHLGTITQTVKGRKLATGVDIRAKIDKNKIGLPFREAAFPIRFGFGIDDMEACVNYLADVKIIKNAKAEIKAINKLDDKAYRKELRILHKQVEKNWREMDAETLPTRSKYAKL